MNYDKYRTFRQNQQYRESFRKFVQRQSYVGNEDDAEDMDCAGEHGTTPISFEEQEMSAEEKIKSIIRLLRAKFRGHEITRLPLESIPTCASIEDIERILKLNLNRVSTDYVGNADGWAMLQNEYMQVIATMVREHSSTTNLCARLAVCYTNQGAIQEEMETVTLLIPDRDRPNQDDFIWCVPIERAKWNKWYALSEKFKTAVPKEHGGGIRYMNRMEGRNVKTVLVMPNEFQSDDDAVTACAFLRLVKNLNCRMYIVRCTDDPLTGARLIHKCAGADITQVEDVEFEGDGPQEKTT